MTQDEIIEMAIEAEFVSHGKPSDEESELFVCVDKDIYKFAKLVAAKALAQQEQEPVAWELGVVNGVVTRRPVARPQRTEQEPVAWQFMNGSSFRKRRPDDFSDLASDGLPYWKPLYTTSPQRTWAGLTDEEMEATFIECGGKWNGDFWKIEDADFHPFLKTIEDQLKDKNT